MKTMVCVIFLLPFGLLADDWNPYWKVIYDDAVACTKEKKTVLVCWEDALPEKCKTLVYLPGKTTDKMRSWYMCAISCEDAGLYARTFGECSK